MVSPDQPPPTTTTRAPFAAGSVASLSNFLMENGNAVLLFVVDVVLALSTASTVTAAFMGNVMPESVPAAMPALRICRLDNVFLSLLSMFVSCLKWAFYKVLCR